MATPIKPTPVLRGKDARRFEENMLKAKQNPVSREEYERIMAVYRSVKVFEKSGCGCSAVGKYSPRAYALVRYGIRKAIATKSIRKLSLFSGIYQSEQFTIEAAYKAFGGLSAKNHA